MYRAVVIGALAVFTSVGVGVGLSVAHRSADVTMLPAEPVEPVIIRRVAARSTGTQSISAVPGAFSKLDSVTSDAGPGLSTGETLLDTASFSETGSATRAIVVEPSSGLGFEKVRPKVRPSQKAFKSRATQSASMSFTRPVQPSAPTPFQSPSVSREAFVAVPSEPALAQRRLVGPPKPVYRLGVFR